MTNKAPWDNAGSTRSMEPPGTYNNTRALSATVHICADKWISLLYKYIDTFADSNAQPLIFHCQPAAPPQFPSQNSTAASWLSCPGKGTASSPKTVPTKVK